MEKEARYGLVGGFIVLVAILLAVVLAWLIHQFERDQVSTYQISFSGSVAGLQDGSQVRYRGVPVGRVSAIDLDATDIERILVTISIDPATPVRENTVAALASQGITGVSTIELEGGTGESPVLKGLDGGLPVIPGRASTLERLFQTTPDLLTEAVLVAQRLTMLLSDENLTNLTAALANIEAVSGDLRQISAALGDKGDDGDLVALVRSITEAAASIETLATNGNTTLSALSSDVAILRDEGTKSLASIDDASDAIQRAARRVDRLTADIDEPLTDFANGGLYDLTKLVVELRQLTAALSRIALEFERDPAGYLLSGSQRGFEPE